MFEMFKCFLLSFLCPGIYVNANFDLLWDYKQIEMICNVRQCTVSHMAPSNIPNSLHICAVCSLFTGHCSVASQRSKVSTADGKD